MPPHHSHIPRKPQHTSVSRAARRRARHTVAVASALSLILVLLVVALAAPADLDTTFDTDGKVTTAFGSDDDTAYALAIQPDGKIVAAGNDNSRCGTFCGTSDFAIARYNPNGSLDTTFDTDGKVVTNFGFSSAARGVAIQPDGKIVVAGIVGGSTGLDFAVARYNADGSLDTSFDGDGRVTTAIGSASDELTALALQPDGKIVVAGFSHNGANTDFAVARYNPNGSLDTSFDADGKVTTNYLGSDDRGNALVLQPDGKIVVAGSANINSNVNFAVVRYNPNGSHDLFFGTGGRASIDFNHSDIAYAVALQPDGKLVLAGSSPPVPFGGGGGGFAVARMHPNGSPDTSFGTDGKVATLVNSINDKAYALALQPDGKIVVAGLTVIGGSATDFGVVRYNPDGSLDNSFDGDGKATTNIGGGNDSAYAMALQPDGKIVVGGYGVATATLDFAIVRYMGDARPNETSNFDTDRRTDIAIWNPANRNWYIQNSTTGITRVVLDWGNGSLGDRAVPGDYDGDNKTDIAVWRETEGNWYIIRSSTGTVLLKNWGGTGDVPVPGDYDLDGKTDIAVFRATEGNWYILNSRFNTLTLRGWGANDDQPVPADYDGDGATDIAVYRETEGNWYILSSRDNSARVIGWGNSTDKPVPADYDGDGRVDVAVFRDGVWFIRNSATPSTVTGWGDAADTPVPADYDGDGRSDIAVYRPSDLNWYILQSATNTTRVANIPQPGVPVASAYLPQ